MLVCLDRHRKGFKTPRYNTLETHFSEGEA
jgi:hypothetical protein